MRDRRPQRGQDSAIVPHRHTHIPLMHGCQPARLDLPPVGLYNGSWLKPSAVDCSGRIRILRQRAFRVKALCVVLCGVPSA